MKVFALCTDITNYHLTKDGSTLVRKMHPPDQLYFTQLPALT